MQVDWEENGMESWIPYFDERKTGMWLTTLEGDPMT